MWQHDIDCFISNIFLDQRSYDDFFEKHSIGEEEAEMFQYTLLQKSAKGTCIVQNTYLLGKVMDAKEKNSRNLYFSKWFRSQVYSQAFNSNIYQIYWFANYNAPLFYQITTRQLLTIFNYKTWQTKNRNLLKWQKNWQTLKEIIALFECIYNIVPKLLLIYLTDV